MDALSLQLFNSSKKVKAAVVTKKRCDQTSEVRKKWRMQGLPGELLVKPKVLTFDWTKGGEHDITLKNKSIRRMAAKLKVTGDHDFYTAVPVWVFVDAGKSCVVKLMRLKGSEGAGTDPQMLIVLESTVDKAATDPSEAFIAGRVYPFNTVQLKVKNIKKLGAKSATEAPESTPAEPEGAYGKGSMVEPAKTGVAPVYIGATTVYGEGEPTSGSGQGRMSDAAVSGTTSGYGQASKPAQHVSTPGKMAAAQQSPVSAGATSGYGQSSAFGQQRSSFGKGPVPPPPVATGSTSAYGNQRTSAYGNVSKASPGATSGYGKGPATGGTSGYGQGPAGGATSGYGQGPAGGATSGYGQGPAASATSGYGQGPAAGATSGYGQRPTAPPQGTVYVKGSTFVPAPAPTQSGSNSMYGKGNLAANQAAPKRQPSPSPPAGRPPAGRPPAGRPPAGQQPKQPRPPAPSGSNSLYGKGRAPAP